MDMKKKTELKNRFVELIDDFCKDKSQKTRQLQFNLNDKQKMELAKKLKEALT
jgi:hypothetical protein